MQNKESKKKSEELLNCPFCGGEAEIGEFHLLDKEYRVCCKECRSRTPYSASRDRVIKQWNTRKPMERIVERLEEESQKWTDIYNLDFERGHINEYADFLREGIEVAIEICKEEGGIE